MSPLGGHFCCRCRREFFFNTVSPLPAPVHAKKSRDNIEKNDILPAPAASQALQNSGNTSTKLANPLKKNLENTPVDLKKRNRKIKKMMGLQRFLLYKPFLS